MTQRTSSNFLFSWYTLDLRWKMSYIVFGWFSAFVYWFDHFGDLLHIFCAPVCTTVPNQLTDFIFTEAAEAFYAGLLMSTYSATVCTCPLVFYFFLLFFRPSFFTAESQLYQHRMLGSLFCLFLAQNLVLRGLMPLVWAFWGGFALSHKNMTYLQPTLGLSPKIWPYIWLVVCCLGMAFFFSQLPLLSMLFSTESWPKPGQFSTRRSLWYFVLLLMASLVSPPDFWLQCSLAFFLWGLFECFILLTLCKNLYKDTESFN